MLAADAPTYALDPGQFTAVMIAVGLLLFVLTFLAVKAR